MRRKGEVNPIELLAGIVFVLIVIVGAQVGLKRYSWGTDAEIRQAIALERIAISMEQMVGPRQGVSK